MANKERIERDLAKRFPLARSRGRATLLRGPRATAVRYVAGKVVVTLDSGVELRFPPALAQGLANASPRELSEVVIEAGGLSLHWPKLDADFYVPALAQGALGTRQWMSHIGRAGGRSRSATKVKAARVNGAKGGRPRRPRAAVMSVEEDLHETSRKTSSSVR